MKSSLLLMVVIACCVSTAWAGPRSLSLKHRPAVFLEGAEGLTASRRAVPLNGGLLVSGAYFVEMTIGSGPGERTFDTIVDTGSSNLGVPSAGCSSCGGVAAQQLYNSAESPTAKALRCSDAFCRNCVPTAVGSTELPADWDNPSRCVYGAPASCYAADNACSFGVTYGGGGGGATVGTIVEDRACLGGSCARAFVEQQLEQYPNGTLSTGIVGLAFPANGCNPTCQPTFLDSLVAQGELARSEDLFGLCLTPRSGGVLDLGYVNSTRYTGPLLYTPVVLQRWYNVAVLDVRLNGRSIGVPSVYYGVTNDIIGSFPDSGTSVVLVGPYTFAAIKQLMLTDYKQLPYVDELFGLGKCLPIANASAVLAAYPTFDFVLAGVSGINDAFAVSIAGPDYVLPVGDDIYCLGIAGVPSIGVILGDVLLQNYYTVFDRVNLRVGFALRSSSCQ